MIVAGNFQHEIINHVSILIIHLSSSPTPLGRNADLSFLFIRNTPCYISSRDSTACVPRQHNCS